jgi:hypothetical protein
MTDEEYEGFFGQSRDFPHESLWYDTSAELA